MRRVYDGYDYRDEMKKHGTRRESTWPPFVQAARSSFRFQPVASKGNASATVSRVDLTTPLQTARMLAFHDMKLVLPSGLPGRIFWNFVAFGSGAD